jgi:L-2,4-diaminobutyrate transaminase
LHEAFDDHPLVGEVRGEGLLAAIELVADKERGTLFDPSAKVGIKVAAEAGERGLIARAMPQGDILGFAPPLCISRREVDEVVGITREAVDAVAATIGTKPRGS